jgi:5,10-methylenetetrahydromethanopterin reductase
LAVGATPERVAWAMRLAATARSRAGLPPGEQVYSLNVPVVVHPQRRVALEMVRGAAASFARYAVMKGNVIGPVNQVQSASLRSVYESYDMNRHFAPGTPQARALSEETVDLFAIAGPTSYCIERIGALVEAGVGKFVVFASGYGIDAGEHAASMRRLVTDVAPAVSTRPPSDT